MFLSPAISGDTEEKNLRSHCIFPPADVLPAHPLHPQSATEEDPLLHLPADNAAAGAVYLRHVPHPVHEDDLPAGDGPADPYQVQENTILSSVSEQSPIRQLTGSPGLRQSWKKGLDPPPGRMAAVIDDGYATRY